MFLFKKMRSCLDTDENTMLGMMRNYILILLGETRSALQQVLFAALNTFLL